jgi:hypothetical protein
LLMFAPDTVSSRTSKATSRLGSGRCLPTWLGSDTEWKTAVANQRGAYSQRKRSALLKRDSGYLSWPTVQASEARQGYQDRTRGKRGQQESLTTVVIKRGLRTKAKSNISGNRRRLYTSPKASDSKMPGESRDSHLRHDVGCRPHGNERLNTRWSETLMGIPVGWTMPSCADPVIPGLTNCMPLETDVSRPK